MSAYTGATPALISLWDNEKTLNTGIAYTKYHHSRARLLHCCLIGHASLVVVLCGLRDCELLARVTAFLWMWLPNRSKSDNGTLDLRTLGVLVLDQNY